MTVLGQDFGGKREDVDVYGSEGNQYGKYMLGGKDVEHVNQMLADAFDDGTAGVGNASVKIGEYKGRQVFEQKAADQIRISLDDSGKAYVKLILRRDDPGLGLVATAGGFKDEGETDQEAADREEREEADSDKGQLIDQYEIARHPMTGDVRVWTGSDRADGVKEGDLIAMSSMAIIPVVKDAHNAVEAGDDATGAAWVPLSDIKDANAFGVKGHARMLLEAATLAGLADQLPDSFATTLAARTVDVQVATDETRALANALVPVSDTPKAAAAPTQKP